MYQWILNINTIDYMLSSIFKNMYTSYFSFEQVTLVIRNFMLFLLEHIFPFHFPTDFFFFFNNAQWCFLFGFVGSSLLCKGFSLIAVSGGCSWSQYLGLSRQWLLSLWSIGSAVTTAGSRAQAQLWRTGLAAPGHVGSSWTRDQTRVPCVGRWVLIHRATREVPYWLILYDWKSFISNYYAFLPVSVCVCVKIWRGE